MLQIPSLRGAMRILMVLALLGVAQSSMAACGGVGERLCNIFDDGFGRPACNVGLVDVVGKCQRSGECGAEGGRLCFPLIDRRGGCNTDLADNGQGVCTHPACGRLGERTCAVVGRLSCDQGLVDINGTCLRKGDCGAEGQRLCYPLVDGRGGCAIALADNGRGVCVHPACGRLGERACAVVGRNSCDAGLGEVNGTCFTKGDCGAAGKRLCNLIADGRGGCNIDLVDDGRGICSPRAQCPYGPDQCQSGFVWREAFGGDHVCVTGPAKAQAADDNNKASSRKPSGGDFCAMGYVWREASPSDHVCVTGAVRTATWADNAAAASRRNPLCTPLTVMGNIQYSETEFRWPPRPVSGAEIELWVCAAVGRGCEWFKHSGGKTDDMGNYSWTIPGRDPLDRYQVRVYARNSAAIVWQSDTGSNFWTDVLPNWVTASPGNPVINLSRVFGNTGNDLFVSRHLNAAQKLLAAREFAMRFRDSSETDNIGRVIVGPSIATVTAFTNAGVIRAGTDTMFDEATLVHEYAHFLQENIGRYHLWPSVHDGCWIESERAPKNTSEFAWFEGFPTFLSKAVRMYFPGSYLVKENPQLPTEYKPKACSAIGMTGPKGKKIVAEAVEDRVTDLLFLLLNDGTPRACSGPVNTRHYRNCAIPIWDKNAKLIMSIFDKELDSSQPDPIDVYKFTKAWLARGGDRAHLDASMRAVGMVPPPGP